MNWTTYDFSPAPCLPCCNALPPSCYLTIPPPVGASPYANISEATTAISNRTSGCTAFANGTGTINSFSASTIANGVTTTIDGNPLGGLNAGAAVWVGLNISAQATLTYDFSVVTASVLSADIDIYDVAGSLVASNSGVSPTLTANVNTAGVYEVRLSLVSTDFTSDIFTQNVTANVSTNACGIRAAYGNVPDYLVCT